MTETRLCDVCGKPVGDWPNRHEYHEPDCPNFVIFESDSDGCDIVARFDISDCDCDLVAHPECCPQCNPEPRNR